MLPLPLRVLLNESKRGLLLSPYSSCLSVCLAVCCYPQTRPSVRPFRPSVLVPQPGLWQPYQRFKTQRESDRTNRQECEMKNTPQACPERVYTTAAAPITFRKAVRFMCLYIYRLCFSAYLLWLSHFGRSQSGI